MRGAHAGFGALVWIVACIAAAGEPLSLRYGLADGQLWRATQTIERLTRIGESVEAETGKAGFEYRVRRSELAGRVALEARMVSQETSAGASPFDFSVIRFDATTDQRGVLAGVHYTLGDVEPPEIEGIERDPVAFRQMLRSVAAAWQEAVFWLPVLPEAPLATGGSFSSELEAPLAENEPGVTMKIVSRRTYTLREIAGDVARFDVEETSHVESSTALSALASDRTALGEAEFDLDAGMWRTHVMRSTASVTFSGATGVEEGAASATSTTRIEMLRVDAH